jgi:hypothetical protein
MQRVFNLVEVRTSFPCFKLQVSIADDSLVVKKGARHGDLTWRARGAVAAASARKAPAVGGNRISGTWKFSVIPGCWHGRCESPSV